MLTRKRAMMAGQFDENGHQPQVTQLSSTALTGAGAGAIAEAGSSCLRAMPGQYPKYPHQRNSLVEDCVLTLATTCLLSSCLTNFGLALDGFFNHREAILSKKFPPAASFYES
ncbi:hypothetical protein Tco_1353125 [Tanacetum coccineum]